MRSGSRLLCAESSNGQDEPGDRFLDQEERRWQGRHFLSFKMECQLSGRE